MARPAVNIAKDNSVTMAISPVDAVLPSPP